MSLSADVSPSVTPSSTPLSSTHAPKYGTVIPNRIFVGGIAANTSELELKQFFTAYGAVKDAKIIADRAGVSKGYGFITFENQEDADRIIKKESDNLVFKDRKLNIGPAVRKQVTQSDVLPRTFDAAIPAGTMLLANGVPYTYQNGMAIFHAPEGGYPIAQPQMNSASLSAMMVPQTPTMYLAPQYTYPPTTPQWSSPGGQWRWTAPQSPQQAVTGSPGYVYATTMHGSPELMYAQAPHGYPADHGDPSLMSDGQQTMEAGLLPKPIEPPILTAHPYLTENVAVTDSTEILHPSTSQTGIGAQTGLQPLTMPISSVGNLGDSSNPSTSLSAFTRPLYMPNPSPQYVGGTYPPSLVPYPPSVTAANQGTLTFPSISASVAPYHKKGSSSSILRRPYTNPALLVKHGHKVQRVMMPTKAVTANGQLTYLRNEFGAGGDMCAETKHTILTPPPTPDV
ncbi:deleted in azoospermia-like isoform X4 [Ostrea edulis]|uniref:deleted in azoospermia-like isoform X4 n=1 Tax=Ostrea edulis TaxID=37623 RepID=UPI0024AFC3D2|nr:deleted in azoospermia-like isoform X4 [Ostrea edulis]